MPVAASTAGSPLARGSASACRAAACTVACTVALVASVADSVRSISVVHVWHCGHTHAPRTLRGIDSAGGKSTRWSLPLPQRGLGNPGGALEAAEDPALAWGRPVPETKASHHEADRRTSTEVDRRSRCGVSAASSTCATGAARY